MAIPFIRVRASPTSRMGTARAKSRRGRFRQGLTKGAGLGRFRQGLTGLSRV